MRLEKRLQVRQQLRRVRDGILDEEERRQRMRFQRRLQRIGANRSIHA